MKIFIFLTMLLFVSTGIKAQDVITLKNGTDIKAVITEVSDDEIRYKRFDNQDGPVFVIKKSEVFMITYQNGTREVINAGNQPVNTSRNRATNKDDGRIRYGGPRVGVTYLTEGTSLQYIAQTTTGDPGTYVTPLITQFGWQFETRFFTLENGASGLVECVPLIGGMERGMFLPSITGMIGFRTAKGHEFGLGPTLSRSGFGMVMAAGSSFTVGNVCFPVNIAYTPSITRMESGYIYNPQTNSSQYYHQLMETGHRISLFVGFNVRKKN